MAKRGNNEGTIYKRADGRYEARIVVGRTPAGNPKRIGKIAHTRKEVAAWLAEHNAAAFRGTLTLPSILTAEQWFDQWLASIKPNVRPNTYHDYEKSLKSARPLIGSNKLRDVSPARVQAMLGELTAKYSPYQNRKTMRVLKACFAEAVRLEVISRNPAAPVKLPRVEKKKILVWTGAEAARMLKYARDTGNRLYYYIHVNLTTGLRREEMLGLRWEDVDLKMAQLHVRQTCTYISGHPHLDGPKTAAGHRTLSLDAETVQVLQAWATQQDLERQVAGQRWQEHGLVFCATKGTPAPESRLGIQFRSLALAAGVPKIRLYDLRHTYGSLAHEVGVPLKLIGERMGHTNVAFTLQTYVHSNEAQRKAAALSASTLFGFSEVTATDIAKTSVAVNVPSGEKNEKDAI